MSDRRRKAILMFVCVCLLLFLSACSGFGQSGNGDLPRTASPTQQGGVSIPAQGASPTATPTPIETPTRGANSAASWVLPSVTENTNHPVLAFYYPWYSASTWCSCTMSDLPTIQYNSSDDSTIARQVTWAANAGITGFISSWWGPGDPTDKNFAKLLAHAAALAKTTGYHFASTIYFESDAPALSGTQNIVNALRYVIANYGNSPYFFSLAWEAGDLLLGSSW